MHTDTDRIYTFLDFYDGIRHGITTIGGRPYVYQSLWTDRADGDDTFLLQPIDDATFHLALEDWAIWIRWDAAIQAGLTTIDTHPALPADRHRHDELDQILTPRLTIDPPSARRARLVYRSRTDGTPPQKWQPIPVQWLFLDAPQQTPILSRE
jgi:hypothetical protein